jgi:hypothetical protein
MGRQFQGTQADVPALSGDVAEGNMNDTILEIKKMTRDRELLLAVKATKMIVPRYGGETDVEYAERFERCKELVRKTK